MILPTYFAPAARGTLADINTIQDVTRLDYNQTIEINLTTGQQVLLANEIYQFEHISSASMKIRVNISANQPSSNIDDLLLSVQSDTRLILSTEDATKYPEKKIELFLGSDNPSTQMSALVHELLYAKHLNDTIFTFSGEEPGDFNGNPVTVLRYDAGNQYVCVS